jgi:peptide/nickel transport system permease protein
MKTRLSSSDALGLGAIVFLAGLIAAAVALPWLGLPDPTRNNLLARLAAPSLDVLAGGHLFGTDQLGRDILARILGGAQVTLTIGAAAVLLGGAVGVTLGMIAGYFGGWLDTLLMRLVDVQLAIPLALLALIVISALGPRLSNLILVLSMTSWVQYARVVRSETLVLREKEFIRSAHAIGLPEGLILRRHILPSVLPAAIVIATIELSRIIILEAALSFLGFGVQPPSPSWGRMLAEGRAYMATAPWVAIMPGLAILLTALAINLLGDWLRDRLDPRTR